MLLRNLALDNYGIFNSAEFDLATTVDQPVILITGNNGAGKTSLLEAIRLALHGRRAFDIPLGEAEYLRAMEARFNQGNITRPCSVRLTFEYVDNFLTKTVDVTRSWAVRRQNIAEDLLVTIDGVEVPPDDADDLLFSVVPPEIARYFFFDGERIRELAEWDSDDESALFLAVENLLGLGILSQLRADLLRIATTDETEQEEADLSVAAAEARSEALEHQEKLRKAKTQVRRARTALDRAKNAVRQIGILKKDDYAALQVKLASLTAERDALLEEIERSTGDVLPLLCAKTLRKRFAKEINVKRRLEEREIVNSFVAQHEDEILVELVNDGFRKADARRMAAALDRVVHGKPLPVGTSMPNLSRSDGVWMERVIGRELPELSQRLKEIVARLRKLEAEIDLLESKTLSAPMNDPVAEAALLDLETKQREAIEHENVFLELQSKADQAAAAALAADEAFIAQRMSRFRKGRLRLRKQFIEETIELIPELAIRLQASKEKRFAQYLADALRSLWHKTDRLVDVTVSFVEKRITLYDSAGEIRKRDLSAGEKQLFAVAFIYALARLSGRQIPFVIDTPLGRLDHEHRRRLVNDFLPKAGHQLVLLSTDTEIVGPLYADLRHLVAQHYELAEYNGGVTDPVEMVSA